MGLYLNVLQCVLKCCESCVEGHVTQTRPVKCYGSVERLVLQGIGNYGFQLVLKKCCSVFYSVESCVEGYETQTCPAK